MTRVLTPIEAEILKRRPVARQRMINAGLSSLRPFSYCGQITEGLGEEIAVGLTALVRGTDNEGNEDGGSCLCGCPSRWCDPVLRLCGACIGYAEKVIRGGFISPEAGRGETHRADWRVGNWS